MQQNNRTQNPYYNNNTNSQTTKQEGTMPKANGQNPYYASNAEPMNNSANNTANRNASIMDSINTSNLLKGALVGAIGAYLLTNENAQKTIFKTFAKGTDMFQAGVEEMKERFEDAKAEIDAER